MARLAFAVRCSLLAVLALPSACAATGDGMQEKLRDTTAAYNRSLRWSDFDRAAGYMPAPAQPAFLAHVDEIGKQLVIVDYDLTRLDLDKQTGVAACRAEISWHTDRRLIVETTAVDQVWQWHQGDFVLVDERRSGGAPLAIFAEPGEDPHPYLPGIEAFRQGNAIGVDEKTQRQMRREARRAARQGSRSGWAADGPGTAAGPAVPLAMDPPVGLDDPR
jgi:hypothetical protein